MKNSQKNYAYLKIKYQNVNYSKNLIEYLKNQDTPFHRILLDSLSMLWMPYVLDDLQLPRKEVEKEIQISYEKLISHLNLMCLELNYVFPNLNESRVSPISNHKPNFSNLNESGASLTSNLKSNLLSSFDDEVDDIEGEENVDYFALMNNDMQF